MTSREQDCVDHAECCESLRRALSILRDLRGVEPRTAIHDAAFHFALVEYAKPYACLHEAQTRRAHPCRLAPPPNLSLEDLVLHRKIMAVRDQLLAQPELTLENALATGAGSENHAKSTAPEIAPTPPLEIDAVISLIERSLEAMAAEKDELLKSLNASRARRRVTIKTVEIAVKTIGIMAGLLGLCALAETTSLIHTSIVERTPSPLVAGIFLLGIGIYFICFACMSFFKYSPLAIRHICGLLAFLAIGPIQKLFDPLDKVRHLQLSGWAALASLACLLALYYAYRFASDRLSQFLFPQKA